MSHALTSPLEHRRDLRLCRRLALLREPHELPHLRLLGTEALPVGNHVVARLGAAHRADAVPRRLHRVDFGRQRRDLEFVGIPLRLGEWVWERCGSLSNLNA